MQVKFLKERKLFRLETEHTSYFFRIGPAGELRHVWYGGKIDDDAMVDELAERRGPSSFSPHPEGLRPENSLDVLPLEYSAYGSGDYRITASALRKENGTITTSTVYRSHKISKGKKTLPGLPASFAPGKDSMTLEVTLVDKVVGIKAVLSYSIFEGLDVVVRSLRLDNCSEDNLVFTP